MIGRAIQYLLLLFIVCFVKAYAFDEDGDLLRPQLGIFTDYDLNFTVTNIRELPGVPNCCNQFNDGFGYGFNAGISAKYPVAEHILLGLNIGYFNLGSNLIEEEEKEIIIDEEYSEALIEHTIESNVSIIGFGSDVNFRLFDGLHIFAGLMGGIVIDNSFDQYEKLMEPKNQGTFENGRRIRNEISGQIPNTNKFMLFVKTGLYYDLPLNERKTLILSPEIIFSSALTSLINNEEWMINSLTIGISLKYSPFYFPLSTPLEPKT